MNPNIKVKVICDSLNVPQYARMTTMEVEYPRIVLSELNTHRMLSKNSASSRAIPVSSMLQAIRDVPAMPSKWGKNQAGMQSKEDLSDIEREIAIGLWLAAVEKSVDISGKLHQLGAHKQIANRVTEFAQTMKTVISATDWNNFWWLRDHPDADPTIHELAHKMKQAYDASKPQVLYPGMWHMPYVKSVISEDNRTQTFYDENDKEINVQTALKVSSSCCAQVSFRKLNQDTEKAEDIFAKLIESKPCHASPTEHQAQCFAIDRNERFNPNTWPVGVTHVNRQGVLYSGNLREWIQHRQLVPDNVMKY